MLRPLLLIMVFTGLLFLGLPLGAQTVDLIVVTTTGEKVLVPVPIEAKTWTFFNPSDASQGKKAYKIASVNNLDALPKLEALEFYQVGIRDYSFLAKATHLKKLHFGGCGFPDFKFLENLVHLEYLNMDGEFPKESLEMIKKTPVDFSRLDKIQFILVSTNRMLGVPSFINVKNKPYLSLNNGGIEAVSDEEIQRLKQYSIINLQFNPIATSSSWRKKLVDQLDGVTLIFDDTVPLPDRILKY